MIHIAIGAVVLGVIFFAYQMFFKKKGTKILVEYSELAGKQIIQHKKLYEGVLLQNKDLLEVKALGLQRPKPPSEVLRPTNGNIKIVGYIKFDEERYGYRIPNINNEVFTYKRDKDGHVLKRSDGSPRIEKKAWLFCDDVKEPGIKHWERYRQKEIREKHKTKERFLNYLPAISLAVIFVFAVVALHLTTKSFIADKEGIMEKAAASEKRADETISAVNRYLDTITGKTEIENEEPPPPP